MRCRVCRLLRRWLIEPLCGPLLFNRDMSLEIDRLTAELDRLLEERGGAA